MRLKAKVEKLVTPWEVVQDRPRRIAEIPQLLCVPANTSGFTPFSPIGKTVCFLFYLSLFPVPV